MTEPLLVQREIYIAAPPATVFALLTDPEKIVGWMGAEATIEAQPGGLYLLKGARRTARGEFREVMPVHRLAYSFGWEGSDVRTTGIEPDRDRPYRRDGGTLLRITHSGLPDAEQCAGHDQGWAHYLD